MDVKSEVSMAVKIQVEVFWIVTQHSVIIGYQHFRGPCCLHLQGEVNDAGFSVPVSAGLVYHTAPLLLLISLSFPTSYLLPDCPFLHP